MNTILVQYGKFLGTYKFTVSLLFTYSVCIVMCEIYLVSSIAILFVFIVPNIGNEWNIILINFTINIFFSRCVLKLV